MVRLRPDRTPATEENVLTGFLHGRTGLILGVANKRSVAWACAKALSREGMQLALTYANERLEGNVRELGKELGVKTILACDVTKADERLSVGQLADEALRMGFGPGAQSRHIGRVGHPRHFRHRITERAIPLADERVE